jgi:uncharacterized protein (UPF0332 family)
MGRAEEALTVAREMFEHNRLDYAVSRLYYACFYAASALLLLEGLKSRKHKGILTLLHSHWIRTGRLPQQAGRFYRDMMDARHDADYEDMPRFTPGDVEKWLTEARGFIDEVKKRIEELTQGQSSSPTV